MKSDLMGDFRVGFLLGTPVRAQYLAQLIGTVMALLVAPSVFVLFATAYPCIIQVETPEHQHHNSTQTQGMHVVKTCEFAGPSIAAWRAVAVAASELISPIPQSSKIFSVYFAVFSTLTVLLKRFILDRSPLDWSLSRLKKWQPNMMIFALAFTLPSPRFGLALVMGAIAAKVWRVRRKEQFRRFGFAVAAGFLAGEGIGGTINCAFSILGFGGHQWGIDVGCPPVGC